jgi:hypothetical protein
MSAWAKTIGGILKVNGFKDFLANYSTTRWAADPIREALAILATAAPGEPKRPGAWAELAVQHSLAGTLIKAGERDTPLGRERAMGVLLSTYQDETFARTTETHRFVFKLTKASRRWNPGGNPHVRYTFEVVREEALEETPPGEGDQPAGPVSEYAPQGDAQVPTTIPLPMQDDLDQYQPEEIPAAQAEPTTTTESVPAKEAPPGDDPPQAEGHQPATSRSAEAPHEEAPASTTLSSQAQADLNPYRPEESPATKEEP